MLPGDVVVNRCSPFVKLVAVSYSADSVAESKVWLVWVKLEERPCIDGPTFSWNSPSKADRTAWRARFSKGLAVQRPLARGTLVS